MQRYRLKTNDYNSHKIIAINSTKTKNKQEKQPITRSYMWGISSVVSDLRRASLSPDLSSIAIFGGKSALVPPLPAVYIFVYGVWLVVARRH